MCWKLYTLVYFVELYQYSISLNEPQTWCIYIAKMLLKSIWHDGFYPAWHGFTLRISTERVYLGQPSLPLPCWSTKTLGLLHSCTLALLHSCILAYQERKNRPARLAEEKRLEREAKEQKRTEAKQQKEEQIRAHTLEEVCQALSIHSNVGRKALADWTWLI